MKRETQLLIVAVALIAALVGGFAIGQRSGASQRSYRSWCDGFEAGQLLAGGIKRDVVGYGCAESVR